MTLTAKPPITYDRYELLRIPYYPEPRKFTFSQHKIEVVVTTPKDSRDGKRRIYLCLIENNHDVAVISVEEDDWYKLAGYVADHMNWTDYVI